MTIRKNNQTYLIVAGYQGDARVETFVENLPERFENEGTMIYNKRNVIKTFELDRNDAVLGRVVVKRYKLPVLFQRIVYSFFRPTKAKRSFLHAGVLLERGFHTPAPIAYLEEREGGLFKYGYFVSEADDAPPLVDKLPHEGDFDASVAETFAAFVADLHCKGILHHDLNCTNVLYHTDDGKDTFSLIDINRMTIYPLGKKPARKECYANLTRFTKRMDILEAVVRAYARVCGWNEQEAVNTAIAAKVQFETQRNRKKAILRALIPGRKE